MLSSEQEAALLLALLASSSLAMHEEEKTSLKQRRCQRRWWVRPALQERANLGQANKLLPLLRDRDVEFYREYITMPPRFFDTLLQLVKHHIEKKDTNFRKAISPEHRLAQTLRFIYVEIGHHGSNSDGGVFSESQLPHIIFSKNEGFLPDAPLGNIGRIPYYLVGDEAFPLKTYLMRPYPRKGNKRIFNYRLSRARRVIENAFGIMAQRWRILRRPFKAKDDNIRRIISACVVLHNYMMKESETSRCAYYPPGTADQVDWQGNITEGNWRADDTSSAALPSLPKTGCHATRFAYEMRDLLAKHFITNGKVPWQESKIMDTRLYSGTWRVLIHFMAEELPPSVKMFGILDAVFNFRPKVEACLNCKQVGHRRDLCPLPNHLTCSSCGQKHPEDYPCTPQSVICGDAHKMGDMACKQRFQRGFSRLSRPRQRPQQEHQQKQPEFQLEKEFFSSIDGRNCSSRSKSPGRNRSSRSKSPG
ncbi:hypothetical protein HPB51_004686 [Rhipicephalus microplus]|uniref:DDE Tnp4 domain-containing protein n=1 Tax=Rhipicephalus microplus TaxID=6941 RepID=A0A9J6DZ13_RHIMP|nr:hypothetical protein HPB51_004686 [Rhipicephalus microplus]